MTIELETMTKADLEKLRADVDRALATLESRRKVEARKAAEQVAQEFGFALDELLGKEKPAAKGGKGDVKYRNPADPRQTWTGRGRQPGWIKAGIAEGRPMSDFAA